jgi:diphosphomevalonate decarboxylase
MKRILARAPSNIAIVKYMGKRDPERNLSANPSLSLTLSGLCTYVELRAAGAGGRRFIREKPEGAKGEAPTLSGAGEKKFLCHLARVLKNAPAVLTAHGLRAEPEPAHAEVRTANTFPTSAGIASSASSFAALTLAAAAFAARDAGKFRAEYAGNTDFRRALAALSREGSGSSCRSFEGPFVAWDEARTERVTSALKPLSDLVVVISAREKKVGSTEAHRRVRSSPHWDGRPTRATNRYRDLRKALNQGNFAGLSEIADAEYRDLHGLFETAVPPFSYFAPGTAEVLDFLENETGIAVTMDAGPNVHVLVPQAEAEHWRRKLGERFPEYPILTDHEGTGAEFVAFSGAEADRGEK